MEEGQKGKEWLGEEKNKAGKEGRKKKDLYLGGLMKKAERKRGGEVVITQTQVGGPFDIVQRGSHNGERRGRGLIITGKRVQPARKWEKTHRGNKGEEKKQEKHKISPPENAKEKGTMEPRKKSHPEDSEETHGYIKTYTHRSPIHKKGNLGKKKKKKAEFPYLLQQKGKGGGGEGREAVGLQRRSKY